jgi:superfamily II DNA or RNA helicase
LISIKLGTILKVEEMIILEEKAKILKSQLSVKQVSLLKSYFTIQNPLFFKLEQMGKPTWMTPKTLCYLEENEKYFLIPLGGAQDLGSIIGESRLKVKDARYENKNLINIKFTGTLRTYQREAASSILKKTIGTLQATTGSGKTVIAIYTICKRRQPTLFLVHTLELANQFKERLLQFTDISPERIGFIGGGKYEIRDISIGMLQTMTKLSKTKLDEINSHFGQVFVDECHVCPADTFYEALSKLKQKYRFGLTATPFRTDGLTKVIFFTTGKIIHKLDPKKAESHLVIPEVLFVETDYEFPIFDSSEHSIMLSDMAKDVKRNELIIKKYKEIGQKRQSVFISHRIDQLNYLSKFIPDSAILTSRLNKKERAKIIEELNNGKLKAVLTTYGLFSTGIDIKTLEVVYMCTPIRSPRWVIQTAGRLKRPAQGKQSALVVDFVDKKVEMLRNQYYARRVIWKKIKNQEV